MAKNEAVQNQKVFITLESFIGMQNRYREMAENVNTSDNPTNRERNLMLMRGYEMALDDTGLPYKKIPIRKLQSSSFVTVTDPPQQRNSE